MATISIFDSKRNTRCVAAALLAFGGLNFVIVTIADARPSTKSYTCEGVKKLVQKKGSIVLNTKNSSVYSKFVASASHCTREQIAKLRTVPVKSGTCRLRTCVPNPDRRR